MSTTVFIVGTHGFSYDANICKKTDGMGQGNWQEYAYWGSAQGGEMGLSQGTQMKDVVSDLFLLGVEVKARRAS